MGKVVGLIGSASGKVGNVVYAVVNGIQTARVYQPIVANPKSEGQIEQRTKMALAGRLSKITPGEAIFGLGKNNRTRRSAFMSNLIRSAVYGSGKASLVGENLKLATGVLPLSSSSTYTITTHSNYSDVDISTTLSLAFRPEGYRIRFVCFVIDTVNEVNDQCQTLIQVPAAGDTPTTSKFRFPLGATQMNNAQVFVYAIPMAPKPQVTGVRHSELGAENRSYVVETELSDSITMQYGSSVLLPLPV